MTDLLLYINDFSNKQIIVHSSIILLSIITIQYILIYSFHNKPYLITSAIFKLTIYSILSIYGIYCLLSSTNKWLQYPSKWIELVSINYKIRLHYLFQISFYLIQIFLLQFDSKAKDSLLMIIHHIITLLLLVYSYRVNLSRIGLIIMILHDINDPFLQTARLLLRLKYIKKANYVFYLFSLLFFITRILLFPLFCIKHIFYYSFFKIKIEDEMFYIFKLLSIFLVCLYILNIIWFIFIVSLLNKIYKGNEFRDITKEE